MTDTYFQLWYFQTSSRNAVNKKLFLTSLLFLARSYRPYAEPAKCPELPNSNNTGPSIGTIAG